MRTTPTAPRLGWVTRLEWWILAGITAVAAVARVGGLSTETLYRDDAWVALTTKVPLSTAARMVVTTPGFVLAERIWIGWFPHVLVVDQLPTYLASVAGVVAVERLARWWGLGAPGALVAAGVVAVSFSDIQYSTRIHPYAFDLLGSCLVLYLAERIRRGDSHAAPWLAAASFAVCAWSLTPVPLVVAVWVAICALAVVHRQASVWLIASGAATAASFGALWLSVSGGISPRLRASWDGNYLVLSSLHGLSHSARTILDGFLRGIGETTPAGIPVLGSVDRAVLVVLFVLGLSAWHRQLLCLCAIAVAVLASVPTLVPIGTGRTDAYLYPAVAMVVAEGAVVAWRLVVRFARPLATVVVAGSLAFAAVLAVDRLVHQQQYPGGNIAIVHHDLEADGYLADDGHPTAGSAVIVGGTARWPWSYYYVDHVRIRFSDLYNNGYTTRSDVPGVIIIPGTPIEGGYTSASNEAARAIVAGRYCEVAYIETDDWPQMPMTLLHLLEHQGHLKLVASRSDVDGYRLWQLRSTTACR